MLSVVIPLYNKARHIRRAIDSVLAQTYQDFELLVVDDGSTDDGAEVVRGIADPRIRLIVQDNAGVSVARNRGIQEAAGDLIAFLDADDEWLPCFLETVRGLRERYPEAGIYATAYCYAQGATHWRPEFSGCCTEPEGALLDDYFRAALGTPPVMSSGVMIPKRILCEAGGFPVGIKRGEDLQVWAAIALCYRVAWSPKEEAVYHLTSDNRVCKSYFGASDMAAASAIEPFLMSGKEPISDRGMVEEYLVSGRLQVALSCHLNGKTGWAKSLLRKSRNTKVFRKRWRVLNFYVRVPSRVLGFLMSIKGAFHPAS
jgi:glycosyltransferase involved in cell wall biosynthesis